MVLNFITKEDVEQLKNKHYSIYLATIIIARNMDHKKVMELVNGYIGSIGKTSSTINRFQEPDHRAIT